MELVLVLVLAAEIKLDPERGVVVSVGNDNDDDPPRRITRDRCRNDGSPPLRLLLLLLRLLLRP